MNTTRFRTLTTRVRRTWMELDYAQRRVFELQTGLRVTDPRPHRDHSGLEQR